MWAKTLTMRAAELAKVYLTTSQHQIQSVILHLIDDVEIKHRCGKQPVALSIPCISSRFLCALY
jgi:hypothetical protein